MHSHIAKALERNGHEVRIAKRGTKDPSILISATEENAVIITYDRAFSFCSLFVTVILSMSLEKPVVFGYTEER